MAVLATLLDFCAEITRSTVNSTMLKYIRVCVCVCMETVEMSSNNKADINYDKSTQRNITEILKIFRKSFDNSLV